MQTYQLMRNAIIESQDSKAVNHVPPFVETKNSLKTIVSVKPSNFFGSGTVYSQRVKFDIPRQYNNLSDIFIKSTLTAVGDADPEQRLGCRVFKNIELRTCTGTILASQQAVYSSARVDEYYNTSIGSRLDDMVEPDFTFADTTVTLFTPLLMFFSENQLATLQTRQLEPLEVICYVNDTKESMGLDVDLTAATFDMFIQYNDTPATLDLPLPKYLPYTFDTFYEKITTIASGATTARLLLMCPFAVYMMHVSLINPADQTYNRINSFRIDSGQNTIVNIDERINFSRNIKEKSKVISSTVSYWFSKDRDRGVMSGLINFNGSMAPTYLSIECDQLDADHELHVICEYQSVISCTEGGKLVKGLDTYYQRNND
jgi:hypothetical protein